MSETSEKKEQISNDVSKININDTEFNAPYDFNNENFNGFFDHIILNLKIIQSINVSDKLSIDENNVHIDQYGYTQWLVRWWYESTRDKSFEHVENLVLKIIDIHTDLNKQLGKTQTRSRTSSSIIQKKRQKMNDYIIKIRNELDNTVQGILNLKETYKDDENYCSKTDTLIAKIKNITSKDKTNMEKSD